MKIIHTLKFTVLLVTAFTAKQATSFASPVKPASKTVRVRIFKDTTDSAIDPLHPNYNLSSLKPWESKFSAFKFNVFKKDGHTLPYRSYRPAKIKKGKKYPLVIFFHGAGERGLDNRLQLMRFTTVPFWETHPCFVLAPQCIPRPPKGPDGDAVWVQTSFSAESHTMKEKPSWPMALSIALLDKYITENNIDKKRIYVTGLSMGGFATWEILQREGKLFAAAMPVCGGADLSFAGDLINIPIWVFHGDADLIVPVKRSRDIVQVITKAGGHPKYTEFPGIGHEAWSVTYPDPQVWEWLFNQHK